MRSLYNSEAEDYQALPTVTRFKRPLAFMALVLCTVGSCLSLPTQANSIERLDDEYKELSQEVYGYLTKSEPSSTAIANTQQLAFQANILNQQNRHIDAVELILSNMELIRTNIDGDFTRYFYDLLLKHNEWYSANALFDEAKINANDYTIAKLEYLLAKYYFERQQWDKSLKLFATVAQNNLLKDHEVHYSLLTQGVLLQRNRQHRQALKYYESIPKDSDFYSFAQLNTAIINIRQGWWTDAHIILKNLLADESIAQNVDLKDRLHVILGYSMLRNEFYRDSREAFRNVRLNGEYANRALLGLALSAANQGDLVGALNALKILEGKELVDIYVEESHLLLPFIYEKLNQDLTASAGYSNAVEYYQQRIADFNSIKTSGADQIFDSYLNNSEMTLNIDNEFIDYSELYPKYFFENITELNAWSQKVTDRALRDKINTLRNQYKQMLVTMTQKVIDNHIGNLNSYLNQSRYGLAKLYDEKD